MRSDCPRLVAAISLTLLACGPARIPGSEDSTGTEAGPTETSGDGSTTSDDSSVTSGFLVPPHDQSGIQCDPWTQDCPEDEKCVAYSTDGGPWNANKCVPIMGDQALGEPCTYGGIVEATDDCDASGMCWNVKETDDGELVGTCMPFCLGSADTPICPDGYYCPVAGDGSVNVCVPECDPVAQDCDLSGTACYWTASWFACVPTTQDIPIGEPCGFINDCVIGHTCINAEVIPDCEGSACCTAFCDISLGDAQCADLPGTACVSFWEEGTPPPEYSHVGICVAL